MEHDLLFDKIERYLLGKMPEPEASGFEAEIAADPELAEKVALQRLELKSMEYMLRKELRQKFAEWKSEPVAPPDSGAPPGNIRRWLLPLLVTLLGLTGIWFFWPRADRPQPGKTPPPVESEQQAPAPRPDVPVAANNQPESKPGKAKPQRSRPATTPDYEPKYLAVLEPAYALPTNMADDQARSRTNTTQPASDDPLAAGIAAYAADSFELAVARFNEITPAGSASRYDLAQKWLAHTYIKLRAFDKAAVIFRTIAEKNSANSRLKDPAEWYYLLCLVPNYSSHKKEVDEMLYRLTVTEPNHRFKTKAAQLREALDAVK